jgi:ATP-binding cassette subfamily B protein
MPKFRLAQKLLDKVNGQTRENVNGIRVVHAYNAEIYQQDKFASTNDELTKTQLFTGRSMAVLMPYITLIMNAISLLVYWFGSYLINDGVTSYPEVLSMMMLSTQIVMSFMMLLVMFFMLPRASVSAKRINEVLATKNSITDPEMEEPLKEQGSIKFDDVSFRYPDGDDDVLSHISFEAKKGETIAFIGATGSGKSTIVNLVSRLYDASEGHVIIDGVDVKNLKQKTLRDLVGFVPQKGLLFSGSVKSNIKFGAEKATDEEVIRAAKVAEADSFIQEMDQKYDASIAQGGSNVSGGQRQRLCIARAVIKNPEFFVFDDSFSALDFKTDRKVRENLKEEAKDATKLIVAQRIGTVMDADHIVVLSEGKMVGYGRHEELLESCPIYRDIALSQLSKEELGL